MALAQKLSGFKEERFIAQNARDGAEVFATQARRSLGNERREESACFAQNDSCGPTRETGNAVSRSLTEPRDNAPAALLQRERRREVRPTIRRRHNRRRDGNV